MSRRDLHVGQSMTCHDDPVLVFVYSVCMEAHKVKSKMQTSPGHTLALPIFADTAYVNIPQFVLLRLLLLMIRS